ncbi:MAG: RsmE family RNA methyltransferase [bacterium]
MRFHRFFIKDKIDAKERVVLRAFEYEPVLSQWKKVFRYITGSRVILFDGSGYDYLCIIEKLDNSEAVLRVLEITKVENTEDVAPNKDIKADIRKKISKTGNSVGKVVEKDENTSTSNNQLSKTSITLLMSLIKNDNFDLVLQKATELGVSQIVPIVTDRTIKKDLNMTRSQRILVEASEQCGRSDVPVMHPIKKLTEAIKELGLIDNKKVGAFVCNQNGSNLNEVLKKKSSYTDLVFLIGPEGGWSPKEIKLFEDSKIKSIKFSQNVLRAETAAIALLALVNN